MDPSLFVVPDDTPKNLDFPHSPENQRRRVLSEVLRRTTEAQNEDREGSHVSTLSSSSSLPQREEIPEDDGGFVMPSTLPVDLTGTESRRKKKSRVEHSKGQLSDIRTAYEVSEAALVPYDKGTTFSGRLGDKTVASLGKGLAASQKRSKAEQIKELMAALEHSMSRCERCHEPLDTFFNEENGTREALRALYQGLIRKSPSSNRINLLPKLWCHKCQPYLVRFVCPLCPLQSKTEEGLTTPKEAAPVPTLRCVKCTNSYHGHCLGMDEESTLALASLLQTSPTDIATSSREGHNKVSYCCPKCTLATAVVSAFEKKEKKKTNGRK